MTAHSYSCVMRRLLCLLLVANARAAVIKQIWGSNRSELLFASSGGGSHVYLSGANIGTAFAPPLVYLGLRGQLECSVQPFTSARNRMHCIITSINTPAPTLDYRPEGEFVTLPLRMYKGGQLAKCWHEGTAGCAVRFDLGATPRVLRVMTPVVEAAGTLRLHGDGIDGGLRGAPTLAATLYRGEVPVLGACGEKDCQASNMGAETVGCASRPDAGGDGVTGGTQEHVLATAFSDAHHFGCVLDALASGLTGGVFNVSLSGITDPFHRGNAYLGFLATRMIDVAMATPFDAEVPPRIASIAPRTGSLAGGTDLTVRGTGFGVDPAALAVEVAGVPCDVTALDTGRFTCRLRSQPPASTPARPTPTAALGPLGSYAGERGVRWQWARSGSAPSANRSLLLPSFALPRQSTASAALPPAVAPSPPPLLPPSVSPSVPPSVPPFEPPITVVVYSSRVDAGITGTPGRPTAWGTAAVTAGTTYRVVTELLRNDLASSYERATAMRTYPVVAGSSAGRYVATEIGGGCWSSCRCTGFTDVCGENGACCRRDSNTETYPECTGAWDLRSYNGHGCLRADWEVLPQETTTLELGECNPDGGDYDCTFFDCSAAQSADTTLTAAGSTLTFEIDLTGHSRDCDCDTETWDCARENTVSGYSPMVAVARFTLEPLFAPPRSSIPAGWQELADDDGIDNDGGGEDGGSDGMAHVLEGWFEAPVNGTYHFLLRNDVASTLSWSGNDTAQLTSILAQVQSTDLSGAVLGPPLPPSAPPSPLPVSVDLWTVPAVPHWTCSEPPCRDEFQTIFGSADATLHKRAIDTIFTSGTAVASRWTGRFRAPRTGTCDLTLDAGGSGSAKLYLSDALAVATTGSSTGGVVSATTRKVSMVADQWLPFELIHYDQGAYGTHPSISARMHCPTPSPTSNPSGIDGDSFPINLADPSARRRARAHHPWPVWPEDADSAAVSPPVDLVSGQRIWLHLECSTVWGDDATCAVGTRILTPTTPHATSLGSSSRRWRARVKPDAGSTDARTCTQITDKSECCAVIGADDDVCVPAVTSFSDGSACAGWSALQESSSTASGEVAACPASVDPFTQAARPRATLAEGTACSSLTDRVACCSSTDGSPVGSGHEGAPCIPAATSFDSGAVCESASYVASSESAASQAASCVELGGFTPLSTQFGEEASVAHDVQRLTMAIAAPSAPTRLTQQMTFDVPDCAPGNDCTSAQRYLSIHDGACGGANDPISTPSGVVNLDACADLCEALHVCIFFAYDQWAQRCAMYRGECTDDNSYPTYNAYQMLSSYDRHFGTATLHHRGASSAPLNLRSATPAQIAAAFAPLRDETYSDLKVVAIDVTNSSIQWTIELATRWESCRAAAARPLLAIHGGAKVSATTITTVGAACLEGGVELSLPGSAGSAFVQWDATANGLTSTLNTLIDAKTASDGVYVTREGNGQSTASFTITFLRGGARPLLQALRTSESGAPLAVRTFAADYASSTVTSEVSVSVERVASGGVELLPIPGRYLSAPSDEVALRLRLGRQSTARCAAPNWEALHVACVATHYDNETDTAHNLSDAFAGQPGGARSFADGFSLERCALHCSSAVVAAVAFAAELDTCTCLTHDTLNTSQGLVGAPAECSATCSSEEFGSQLCGNAPPLSMASLYLLPDSLSTSGDGLPCSFAFDAGATPTLTSASSAAVALNASLELTGSGFASGTGAPTVSVCDGRACAVASYNATSISCVMPDCAASASPSPILVHVPPLGFALQDGSVVAAGALSLAAVSPSSGSAAGGVQLTLTGTGFAAALSRVRVSLLDGSTELASCTAVSVVVGTLECLTAAAPSPLAAAGTSTTVRVATLDEDGSEGDAVSLVGAYTFLAQSSSMTMSSLDLTQGSTAGGLLVCVGGTNLDQYAAFPLLLSPSCSFCLLLSPALSFCLLLSPALSCSLLHSPSFSFPLLLSPSLSFSLLLILSSLPFSGTLVASSRSSRWARPCAIPPTPRARPRSCAAPCPPPRRLLSPSLFTCLHWAMHSPPAPCRASHTCRRLPSRLSAPRWDTPTPPSPLPWIGCLKGSCPRWRSAIMRAARSQWSMSPRASRTSRVSP